MDRSYDILLIHSLEDLSRVQPLAAALEASGWTVGRDVSALTGGVPHQAFVIERELQKARCAVVVWSSVAETSNAVVAGAAAGPRWRELILLRLDDTPVPAELGGVAAIDFTGWDGGADAPAFRALAGAVSEMVTASREDEAASAVRSPSDDLGAEPKPVRAAGNPSRLGSKRSRLKRALRWLLLGVGLLALARLALDGAAESRLRRAGPPEENFNSQPRRLGPVMVVVPYGSFTMGSPKPESGRDRDEGPRHQVTIARPFALGRYEVTFDEYDEFARATGRDLPGDQGWGRGRRPVINVSWDDARAYAQWLSEKTGQRYRLPSEAEWEYAARAGTWTARHWGDDASPACLYANVDDASLGCQDGYPDRTAPVGSFKGNAFGLQDLLGNVWEWVEDCWHDSYQGAPADGTAWVGGDCGSRVLRGGSWIFSPEGLRAATRSGYNPGVRLDNFGFRLARDLP